MGPIPPEIFAHFTSYLTFCEKRQALLVCREWHEVIKSTNLYADFTLYGNEKFQAGEEFLKQNETYAKQVKSLRLVCPKIGPSHILTIPEHFPNLQNFEWVQTGLNNESFFTNDEDGKYWKNITNFLELNSVCLAIEILENNGFCNLKKLHVNFCSVYSNCQLLISQLSKAPALKELTIESTMLSLFDLENLHSNATKLETLHLSLITPKQLENDEIMPASKVKADKLTSWEFFELSVPEDVELWSSWMGYIASTYKNLKHLTIESESVLDPVEAYETKLMEIAAACPLLESYHVNISPIKSALLDAMDSAGIHLKKIELKGLINYQVSNVMLSHQLRSLETLVLNANSRDAYEFLEVTPGIKHLELTGDCNSGLAINELLENSHHLETIKVSNWTIQLGSDILEDNFQRGLKSLILENVKISYANGDVMSFVSAACPELSTLAIQGVVVGSETLNLTFPNHHFASIQLDIEEHHVYKIIKQGRLRSYKIEAYCLYEVFAPISEDQPHVLIVIEGCGRLKIGDGYICHW
ncbi:hypothetical protein BD408DRAFT_402269 [Parasitella parasitica]|nr:hypothetical protein BD408DRAFT_402269 [Parasitella parasitica]